MVLPVQSFFQNVPYSVEVVSSDQSVAAFLQLEPTFVGVGTSGIYSPWDSADFFGRAEILKRLDPNGTSQRSQNLDPAFKNSNAIKSAESKKSKVSKTMSHLLTRSELSQSAENLLAATSSKF